MRYPNLLLLLVTLFVSCSNLHKPRSVAKDSLTFYYYGLGDISVEKAKAEYVVAKRWGITYKSVANCVVDKKLADSAENHNRQVELLLSKKYGTNWKAKMDKAIVKEMQVQQQILDLLTSNRSYQQTVRHYNKKGIYVDIWFEAKSNNIYDVALVTQDWANNRSIAIERAHYHIDLQTQKIRPLAFNSLAASYFTHE